MAHFDKDVRCREIYTQAVCGKGSKYSQTTYTIRPANRPSTIGGCWVMNHSCNAELVGDFVEVHGRFDVNVWYSYGGNTETAVAKDSVSYVQQIPIRELDPYCSREGMEVKVRVLQQPNCLDATVVDGGNEILVRVEKELAVELMGRTKIYVLVCDPPKEKEDDHLLEDDDIFEEEDFED
ncbi:outer spore coat protein CotE [Effusibacillus dendaii]|uniref:Spore coat protein E n=1 Tax=Effusibacillus dendaii TaxID=2743772 RepID=A0A7I8D6V7_9BACL|nr:outer spore coat protein CotE [Effusibacillus dendaii]BCJ85737.1 spore coat protein E [Effusibacillus dendaii]